MYWANKFFSFQSNFNRVSPGTVKVLPIVFNKKSSITYFKTETSTKKNLDQDMIAPQRPPRRSNFVGTRIIRPANRKNIFVSS